LELTATVEFGVLGAGLTGADVVGLLMAAEEFTDRLALTATVEFAVLGAGVTGVAVVELLMTAEEFTESLELTDTVEFAVMGALVTGADVGLLKNTFKKFGIKPKSPEPEPPPNCGRAITAQEKNIRARSTCKTGSKFFTVRTYSVFLFAEDHLGVRKSSK